MNNNVGASESASSTTSISGSCLCGSIKVTISDDELFTKQRGHICNCKNCRKSNGTVLGATNLLIEKDKVTIEDINKTLKEYMDVDTGSGNPTSRFFCSKCGSPIKSDPKAFADKVVVRLGLFPHAPAPEFEAYGSRKYGWQGKIANVITYKEQIFGEKLE